MVFIEKIFILVNCTCLKNNNNNSKIARACSLNLHIPHCYWPLEGTVLHLDSGFSNKHRRTGALCNIICPGNAIKKRLSTHIHGKQETKQQSETKWALVFRFFFYFKSIIADHSWCQEVPRNSRSHITKHFMRTSIFSSMGQEYQRSEHFYLL